MLLDLGTIGRPKISDSKTAWEIISKFHFALDTFEQEKEYFYVLGLSRANRIRYIDVVSIGSAKATIAEVREVYRMAIHQGIAGGIICLHNHPSGNLQPSEHDKALTTKLSDAGKIIGIDLFDHIIFSEEGHFSFADEGLI